MRKLAGVAAVAAATLLAAAGTVWADKPSRTPLPPFGDPVTFDAGLVCSFALTVEELANNGTTTTHYDKQGDVRWEHGSGTLVWRFTGNGTSVDLNISGPGKITEGADGLVHYDGTGPWALLFFPGDDPGPAGSGPTALLTRGHIHATFNPDTGQFTLVSYTGRAESICGMLA